jgi:O-antigen ligase
MARRKDSLMRNSQVMMIRAIPKYRGAVIIVGSVLVGLVLARFMMISPTAAIIALSSGIVLAITIFLRKTDYLIYAWFFLTSLIWFIMGGLLPWSYYEFIGRGVFWGLLLCIIVAWAMDNVLKGRRFLPFDNVPLKTIILIFVIWCTMTLFVSIDVLNSVKKLSHIVIAFTASYMFYDFFSRDKNNINKMLRIVSLVIILVSFAVVTLAIRGLISGAPIYKEISTWFLNPNVLGSFLFICSPLLITSGFDFRPIKRLKFIFVSLMLLSLYLSFHRTSWLAILISVIYLLWKGRAKLSLAAVSISIIFVAGLTFPLWGVGVYGYLTGERYTGRKIIWQGAWDAARDHPVLGAGMGNSAKIMGKYISEPYYAEHFYNAHNVYLQNAVDMGLTSVVITLVFYAIFLYSSERIEKNLKSRHLALVVRGTTATFLGLLVHGIFESSSFLTSFDAGEFHVLFPYILIGLPFACKKLEERKGLAT